MMDINNLGTLTLAAGAVGTAAMGLVEALKWTALGVAGLEVTKRDLSAAALRALERVYGTAAFDAFLAGAWRKSASEFEQTLSNGLRLAVFMADDIDEFVRAFGEPDPAGLRVAIELLRTGDPGGSNTAQVAAARARLARLETVIDARVKAAVAAGRDQYTHRLQIVAGAISMIGCLLWSLMSGEPRVPLGEALLIGMLAVPLAPVAKDVVTFLNSLRSVFEKKRATAG